MITQTSASSVPHGTLYTLGYAEPEAGAQLERLMRDPRTLLLDIRLSPRSRWFPLWNQHTLSGHYGERYLWDQRLGNLAYRQKEAPIQLAPGHMQAVAHAAQLLTQGISLVLLCACRDSRKCHRTPVAKLIQDAVDQLREKGNCS